MRAFILIVAFLIAGLFWTLWQEWIEPSGLTHLIGVLIAVGFFFWAWDWSKRFSKPKKDIEQQFDKRADNAPAKSLSDIPTSETPTKVPPQRLKAPSPNPQTTINYKAFGIALAVLFGFIALGVILEESFDATTPTRTTNQSDSGILSWESNDPRIVNAMRQWAEVGNREAQFRMGLRHSNGEGVIQDYVRSFCWYQHAAERGHQAAMNNLGVMYSRGRGVDADRIMAHKWYNLAAARGDEQAKKNRSQLADRMDQDQIERAQALARAWQARWEENDNPFKGLFMSMPRISQPETTGRYAQYVPDTDPSRQQNVSHFDSSLHLPADDQKRVYLCD